MLCILGLTIVANIRQDEYMPEYGDIAGIRVALSPQNQMVFPEDEGVTVSPGHVTAISVTKVRPRCHEFTLSHLPFVIHYLHSTYHTLHFVALPISYNFVSSSA